MQDMGNHANFWIQRTIRGGIVSLGNQSVDTHRPGVEDSFGLPCLDCGLQWMLHPNELRARYGGEDRPAVWTDELQAAWEARRSITAYDRAKAALNR